MIPFRSQSNLLPTDCTSNIGLSLSWNVQIKTNHHPKESITLPLQHTLHCMEQEFEVISSKQMKLMMEQNEEEIRKNTYSNSLETQMEPPKVI